MDEPIHIARKKWSTISVFASAVLGLFFFIDELTGRFSDGEINGIAISILLLMTLFLTVISIVNLRQLLKTGPALIISNEGLTDYLSFASPGLIKWEEIDRIEIKKVSRQKNVIVFLKNDLKIMTSLSGSKKNFAQHTKKKTGSAIALNEKLADFESEDLMNKLNQMIQNHAKSTPAENTTDQ